MGRRLIMKFFTKDDTTELISFAAIFVTIVIAFTTFIWAINKFDQHTMPVCVETATVVELVKFSYRTAYVRIESGEIVTMNQPRPPVEIGSEYCTKRIRANKLESLQ
jgi:hypothetical protein